MVRKKFTYIFLLDLIQHALDDELDHFQQQIRLLLLMLLLLLLQLLLQLIHYR